MTWKLIYFILLILVPIIVFLVHSEYLYAGIWFGIGGVILFLELSEKGRKIMEDFF
ncbi:hypothetical protein [Caminibacter sp.]